MAELNVAGSNVGNSLQQLLLCDEIVPGAEPSYQTCKTIFLYHPLGRKMAESPIRLAQSQQREISIPGSPEERIKEQFMTEWVNIGADKHIANTMRTSRIYGIASIIYGAEGIPTNVPIEAEKLSKLPLYFNVFDPLNTAGSLVLDQNPNSATFQKHRDIVVSGATYHRSRTCVVMNEEPIYISYTTASFGFVGRSVYQRALFPLKTFVQSMITDDMVTKKAGLLVAMMKQVGSIIDQAMAMVAGVKRSLLKEAATNNVISIATDEKIETLNMQNTDTAMTVARKNVLENIAVAADMPAKMLNSETFAEGFGEGTEDAKAVAHFIDGIREEMAPLYEFFDRIVMYRAWNEEFYAIIQKDYPEYKRVPYKQAFYQWKNAYKAQWPSLLIEPDSERAKSDDVKLKAVIALMEVMLPEVDPINKGALFQWAQDNFNNLKVLFASPLDLDIKALQDYVPPQPMMGGGKGDKEPAEPKPFAAAA